MSDRQVSYDTDNRKHGKQGKQGKKGKKKMKFNFKALQQGDDSATTFESCTKIGSATNGSLLRRIQMKESVQRETSIKRHKEQMRHILELKKEREFKIGSVLRHSGYSVLSHKKAAQLVRDSLGPSFATDSEIRDGVCAVYGLAPEVKFFRNEQEQEQRSTENRK